MTTPTPLTNHSFEQARAAECPARGYGICHLVNASCGFQVAIPQSLCEECFAAGGHKSPDNPVQRRIISNSITAATKNPSLLTSAEQRMFSKMHNVELTVSASKPDRWQAVASTWQQAQSFAKSIASRGILQNKRASSETIALRQLSCFGDPADGIPACSALARSNDGTHHFCNECGCGDREIAHLDRDKLSFPYLECPRARPGFSNAPVDKTHYIEENKALLEKVNPILASRLRETTRTERAGSAVSKALQVEGTTTESDLQTLAHLILDSGARTVFEIGTYKGRTATLFAAFGCKVVTVDDASGRWIDKPDPASDRLTPPDIEGDVQVIHGADSVADRDFIERRLLDTFPSGADLAFIDGNHSAEYVTSDIELARTVVRRGGVIVGHDIALPSVEKAALASFSHVERKGDCWWATNPGVPSPSKLPDNLVVFDADGGIGDCVAYAHYARWYASKGIPCLFVTNEPGRVQTLQTLGCVVVPDYPGRKIPIGGRSTGFRKENDENWGRVGRLSFRARDLPHKPGFLTPETIISDLDRKAGEDLVRSVDAPVVVMIPHAHYEARVPAKPNFIDTAWLLHKKGYHVISVFGTHDEWKRYGNAYPHYVYGLRIPTIAALMQKAAVVVGGDTGPTHLAAALGVRTLALMGPTSNIFREYGPKTRELHSDMKCTGCWWRPNWSGDGRGYRAACDYGCYSLARISPEILTQQIEIEVELWRKENGIGTSPSTKAQ